MRISIFGAGYVGIVSGACLAERGHDVIMVDVDQAKVQRIAAGESPVVEPELPELLSRHVASGRVAATRDAMAAVADTDMSLVCVGTPSKADGGLNLDYVVDACRSIGAAIAAKGERREIIIRSTMLPGSMRGCVIPTLQAASGGQCGGLFGVAAYPEFMREGNAIQDFFNPAIMLLGVEDETTLGALRQLNAGLGGKEVVTDIETAEAAKYANNAWHAVKLTFANEIGNVCKAAGIDGQAVMDILCEDDRLNISKAYMRPGYAFGGSCLPKDLRALRHLAGQFAVPTPLFDATQAANDRQIEAGVELVEAAGGRKICLLGLAFKAGTADLRESPLAALAERLVDKGYELTIYDSQVRRETLKRAGVNGMRVRVDRLLGHLSEDMDAAVQEADVIVVGNGDDAYAAAVASARPNQKIVDLARIAPGRRSGGNYEGICW